MDIIKELHNYGLVPVIKITDVNNAVPLAKALCDGGLNCAEITFRTACAKEAIAKITKELPDMLVGAGTVLTPEQADEAIEAGSKFIVSPGLNPRVVKHCLERGVPVLPGVATPSEVEQALELGLKAVKFFPAEAAGGVKMIKNLLGAFRFTGVKFMPTGGVNPQNVKEYLSVPEIVACGGTWIVPKDALANGDWAAIEALAAEAAAIAKER